MGNSKGALRNKKAKTKRAKTHRKLFAERKQLELEEPLDPQLSSKNKIISPIHFVSTSTQTCYNCCKTISDCVSCSVISDDLDNSGAICSVGQNSSRIHSTPKSSAKSLARRRIEISSPENNDLDNYQLVIGSPCKDNEKSIIKGYRIVEIDYFLNWCLKLNFDHRLICTLGYFDLLEEKRRGIQSTFVFECRTCKKRFLKTSESPNEKTMSTRKKTDINSKAVWATLSVGNGYSQLDEWFGIMDIPSMTWNKFSGQERFLEKYWEESLLRSMTEAGNDERELALAQNHVDDDGVPCITVYLDGGWCKRSYGHNYNAASGVACIIGRATKKLLFLGVRNKYCYACALSANRNETPKEHLCYRNWDKSSSAMEADIVVEGFKCSEAMHGVRYLKFIADGDSSVQCRIIEKVPYGRKVQKLECANHAVKNYTKALHKISLNTKLPCNGRKRLRGKIHKLTAAARGAITHNSKGDSSVANLRHDLHNGPAHVFGDHAKCRPYFCQGDKEGEENILPELKKNGIFPFIMASVDSLAAKADRLYANETSNRAELFMSILAKINSGKRINFSQKGSYQRRSLLSGLNYQKGSSWHGSPWKNAMGKSPGAHFKTFMEKRKRKREVDRKKEDIPKEKRRKVMATLLPIEKDYGPKADTVPLTLDQFEAKKASRLENFQVTISEQIEIEKTSRGQHANPVYVAHREHRLTASTFGLCMKRKATTSCHNLVKSILYKQTFSSECTEYGKANETVAIRCFMDKTGYFVRPSGLYVDLKHGYLAASPDGVIDDEQALVEVKTAPSAIGLNLTEAIKNKKIKFLNLTTDEDGKTNITLKRSHAYFYQIQGQLNIADKNKCFFVVYIDENNPIFVEEIERDGHLWQNVMLPKLCAFFNDCLLPEILDPQIPKGQICKDPLYIIEAQNKLKLKKEASKSDTKL